jgi:hypothetical protein
MPQPSERELVEQMKLTQDPAVMGGEGEDPLVVQGLAMAREYAQRNGPREPQRTTRVVNPPSDQVVQERGVTASPEQMMEVRLGKSEEAISELSGKLDQLVHLLTAERTTENVQVKARTLPGDPLKIVEEVSTVPQESSPPQSPVALVEPPVAESPENTQEVLSMEQEGERALVVEESREDKRFNHRVHLVRESLEKIRPHRHFRRALVQIHRGLGYSGWPKEVQEQFDEMFHKHIKEVPGTVNMVRFVEAFEYGRTIGDKKIAEFMALAVGFTILMALSHKWSL